MSRIHGSYSLTIMHDDTVMGVRDPEGTGRSVSANWRTGTCRASESAAIDTLDGELVRDVQPGELVVLHDDGSGYDTYQLIEQENTAHCFFRTRLLRAAGLHHRREARLRRRPPTARPVAVGRVGPRFRRRLARARLRARVRVRLRRGGPGRRQGHRVRRGADEEPVRRPDVHHAHPGRARRRRPSPQAESDQIDHRGPDRHHHRRLHRPRHHLEPLRPSCSGTPGPKPSTSASARRRSWRPYMGIDMATREELIGAEKRRRRICGRSVPTRCRTSPSTPSPVRWRRARRTSVSAASLASIPTRSRRGDRPRRPAAGHRRR